jgi:hypothetical protein
MSELRLCFKRGRLAQLGPLATISVGIIALFAGTAFLCWLTVCIFSGL